jgi:hypothetical protein
LKWTRREQECPRASADSEESKTVQCILRHAKIQKPLDLYTQAGSDEARAAQGEFLSAAGMKATVLLICGLSYGLKL